MNLNWETVPGNRASRAEGSPAICRHVRSRNEQISSVCRPVAGQMEIVAHRNAQFPQIRRTFSAKRFVNQSTQFKTDSLRNTQPVEFSPHCGSGMVILP